MWSDVSADVRRVVVASLPLAAMRVARDVDRELARLVDDEGTRRLARELVMNDPERAAAWMAEDAGGWRVALARLHGATAPPTPTGSGIGRYLTELALGRRPAWPARPGRSRGVWDCHPYDPEAPARARRVLVVVGDDRGGVGILLECMMRILPIGVRAWIGGAASCPPGHDMVIIRGGSAAAVDAAIARLDAGVATVVVAVPTLADASAWVRGNATSVVRMGHRAGRMEHGQLLVQGRVWGSVVPVDRTQPRLAWGVQYRPGSERVRCLRADVAPDDRLTRLMFLS
jgi:hypothetical protein